MGINPTIKAGEILIRHWPNGTDIQFGWEHLDVRSMNRRRICRIADGTETWEEGTKVYEKVVVERSARRI